MAFSVPVFSNFLAIFCDFSCTSSPTTLRGFDRRREVLMGVFQMRMILLVVDDSGD
jgi:hypothetical protein